ncbi:Kinesin-related protein 4 [Hondaea fermentalgiana]|uniref:Kinesin-related protein 4 n=1 Tax=Hondaea fermentalgiana TaxID=2315210 RepID=A0A2R5GB61_9STRA|nr:Kinesin-related protein 4 [Hondaea fermentalgiana]|eukprot:GBG24944.1 Kinesin-related protein 4 [Hondaea fermentalgiana]
MLASVKASKFCSVVQLVDEDSIFLINKDRLRARLWARDAPVFVELHSERGAALTDRVPDLLFQRLDRLFASLCTSSHGDLVRVDLGTGDDPLQLVALAGWLLEYPISYSLPAQSTSAWSCPQQQALEVWNRVKVCVRVRPVREEDVAWHVGNQGRALVEPGSREDKTWTFDHVFDESSTNVDVFQDTVADLVPRVLEGYHGTALVYGQTSSGKTYTMFGGDGKDAEVGAVQLGLEALFAAIAQRRNSHAFSVELSYVEVYNEVIGDLLAPSSGEDVGGNFRTPPRRTGPKRTPNSFQTPPSQRGTPRTQGAVSVRDDLKGGVTLSALRKPAGSVAEAMSILQEGASKRHVSSTGMNERSSRAHTILMVHVSSVSLTDSSKLSAQLNFVDLAGSESMRTSNAKGSQIAEAKNINQSLLALALAMANLAEGANATPGGKGDACTPQTASRHVSFRTSKLTRILKPALCGDSLVCVICCITPASRFKEESKRTLQFARTAARVPVQASRHESQAPEATIEQLKRKVALLRAQSAPTLEMREKENREREEERSRFRRLLLLAHNQQSGGGADPEDKNLLPLHLISPSSATRGSKRGSLKHRRMSIAGTPPMRSQRDQSSSSVSTPPIEQMYTRQLQQKVQSLKSTVNAKSVALVNAQHELEECRDLLDSQSEDLARAHEEADALRESKEVLQHEHVSRQAALVAEVVRLRQDVDNLACKLTAAEARCTEQEELVARASEVASETEAGLKADLDGLRQELANAKEQLGKARARLQQRERDANDVQAVIAGLRKAQAHVDEELSALREELDIVRAEKLAAQDAQAYLEEHSEEQQAEVADLGLQLRKTHETLSQRDLELAKMHEAAGTLNAARALAQEEAADLRKSLARALADRTASEACLEARVAQLEQMAKDYEAQLEEAYTVLAQRDRELEASRSTVWAMRMDREESDNAIARAHEDVEQARIAGIERETFLQKKCASLQREIEYFNTELEKAYTVLAHRDRQLEGSREQVYNLKIDRRALQEDVIQARDALASVRGEVSALTNSYASERNALQLESNSFREQLQSTSAKLAECEAKTLVLEEQTEKLQSEKTAADDLSYASQAEICVMQQKMAQMKENANDENRQAQESKRDTDMLRTEAQLAEAQAQVDERAQVLLEKETSLNHKDAQLQRIATELRTKQSQLHAAIQSLRAKEEELKAREDELEGREAEVQIRLQKFDTHSEASFHTSREEGDTPFMTPISQYASFVSATSTPIPFSSSLLDTTESPALLRKLNQSAHQLRQVQQLEILERELGLSPISSSFLLSSDLDLELE